MTTTAVSARSEGGSTWGRSEAPGGRFPSLHPALMSATTDAEIFRIAVDALTAAGWTADWQHLTGEPGLPLHSPQTGTGTGTAAGSDVVIVSSGSAAASSLTLRIDVRHEPRALLHLRAEGLSAEDLPAARLFAGQLALACESVETIAELSRRNAELAARNRLAEAAAFTAEFDQFLRFGVETLRGYLRCDGLSLYLVDAERKDVVLAEHVGGTKEAERHFGRVPLGRGLVGRVAADGEARCWHPEDFGPATKPVIERMGFGTGLAVPLRTRSKLLGVINAAWFERREVPASERQAIDAMGTHFAAAIEAQSLTDQLRRSVSQLARTQAQLVEHERMAAVGEMAALLAHEVRTPLGVLYNAVGCLRRGPPAHEQRELMDMVMEEGERLSRMVDDLLQLAQPSVPRPEPTELRALLEGAVQTVQRESTSSATAFSVQVAPDVGEVPVDPRLIRQGVVNLLQNAVQALPRGGRIEVHAQVEAVLEGRVVILRVRDTGAGVPEALRERIFDPFFTTRARGAGLGLALTRRIFRSHGGELALDAAEPGRTTFRATLPLPPR